jgi:cell shape-determining protein MreC
MQYAPITAVLVEAIKEQQQIIEKQQAEIDALKAQNAKINQLEAMLMELKAEQSASKTAE